MSDTVTANELSRGYEGSGAAQIIPDSNQTPVQRYHAAARTDERAAAEGARKKAQQESYNKVMETDIDFGWQKNDQQVQDMVDKYRSNVAWYANNGGDLTDPTFQRVAQEEKDKIGLYTRRSTANKEVHDTVFEEVNTNDEFNENAKTLLAQSIHQDEELTRPKDAFELEDKDMLGVLDNYHAYNMGKVWDNVLDNFEEVAMKEYTKRFPMAGKEVKDIREWAGKFYKLEGEGRNQRMVLDMNIDDLNDPTKAILMQYDKVKNYVDQRREEGATEQEIWGTLGDRIEADWGSKRSESTRTDPKHIMGNNVTFDRTPGSVMRTVSIAGKDGDSRQIDAYTPDEITVSGEKTDREIPVQPNVFYNLRTGKMERAKGGNYNMVVTSIRSMPWTAGEAVPVANRPEEDDETAVEGKYGAPVFGTPKELWKKQKSGTTSVRWFVQGTVTEWDEELMQETTKEVLVPLHDVADQLKNKTGFSLAESMEDPKFLASMSQEAQTAYYMEEMGLTFDEAQEAVRQIKELAK